MSHTFENGIPKRLVALHAAAMGENDENDVASFSSDHGRIEDIRQPIEDGSLGYVRVGVNEKALKDHEVYSQFLTELKALCSLGDVIKSPRRLDALQLIGMLCVALLVPFGSVLVGGKLIKDWYANDNLVKKQQYVYGIFHLYRNHMKEFLDQDMPGKEMQKG